MTRITVFVCLLILLVFTWFERPQLMSKLLLSVNNSLAGLSSKTIETPLGKIHYLEGGRSDEHAETIVLLHGIFARKEHWVDLARQLTPFYRVIALDLPGFGNNEQLGFESYFLPHQKHNLSKVLKSLNVKRAHVGANSMGAAVAGLLATSNPDLVQSIAFIGSPLGVKSSTKSEMELAIEDGVIPLLVQSEEEFIERNAWLFPVTPYMPSPILKTWMSEELSTISQNMQIWYAANNLTEAHSLQYLASKLEMPSLILWCKQDRIFHVSGAGVLHDELPNSQLEILDGCGHLPMLDKAEQVAELYLNFLMKPKAIDTQATH
ncbi:alpha/beta fold hydrolase [Glaciecola sp. KUL10]|uniref:alpha/beta fold hydrolase n=1 Tax=Glaciecola sp. (strain KUL10) TaxID=2161813 RepID=UPI000D785127|nr:alpha/beta hydrolase [Glaciecola sp. KUL10]GBL05911.1 hypothetical protein KUL10_32440 [Glaciecola sp. KUL10]